MLRSIFLATALLLAPAVRAVIVSIDNTTTYTTAPVADDFGFASVGKVRNNLAGIFGSGVYLGDGWVISAYHNVANGAGGFTFGPVVFGATTFEVDPLTGTRLHNPDLSLTDLAIFRLTAEPTVPAVTLSGVAPGIGIAARMMGNGNDRMATQTRWSINTVPATWEWTEVGSGGNAVGYKLQPGSQTLRWGNNQIETLPAPQGDIGFGSSIVFRTDFGDNALSAPSGEGQATPGDSGGGVFTKNGAAWELSGVILYTGGYNNQPAATSVYGNPTLAASIAVYKTEIEFVMATVPEPSSALLLCAGAGLLARRRRHS